MLDEHYIGDANQRVFTLCDEFEQLKRSHDENVRDFVPRWENKVEELKVHGVVYSEPALAYKLITAANIDSVSVRIIRSTIKDLTRASMKEAILKVFDKNLVSGTSGTISEGSQEMNFKEEPVFFNQSGGKRKFNGSRQGQYGSYNTRNNRSESDYSMERGKFRDRGDYRRRATPGDYRPYKRVNNNSRINSLDEEGNPSKCNNCGSIYHWWKFCDKKKEHREIQYAHEVEEVKINLFTRSVDESQDDHVVRIDLLELADDQESESL